MLSFLFVYYLRIDILIEYVSRTDIINQNIINYIYTAMIHVWVKKPDPIIQKSGRNGMSHCKLFQYPMFYKHYLFYKHDLLFVILTNVFNK